MKKGKILFVYPRTTADSGFKPIGISILSAIAKEEGYDSCLYDTGTFKHEYLAPGYDEIYTKIGMFKPVETDSTELVEKTLSEATAQVIGKFNPDIVSFSINSPQEFVAREINKYIKEISRDIVTIWGGFQVTINPKEALEFGADYVNVGEGLISFRDFLFNDCDDSNIPNIGSKHSPPTEIPKLLENLDTLPYQDYSIYSDFHFQKPYEGQLYRGGDHMLTWGCVNSCSYCFNQNYVKLYKDKGLKYAIRRYSNKRIIDELKFLKNKYNLNFLKFTDEDFFLKPLKSIKEFSELYKNEVALPFAFAAHPKSVTEGKIQAVKDAGGVSISIGIESGEPIYRSFVLKRTESIDDITNAFALCKKYQIRTMAFNICALPHYTRCNFEATVNLNKKVQANSSAMSYFVPFEGLELAEYSFKEKLVERDWKNVVGIDILKGPILKNDLISDEEMKGMRDCFQLYIKLPYEYHPYIRRSETLDKTGTLLRETLYNMLNEKVSKNIYNLKKIWQPINHEHK